MHAFYRCLGICIVLRVAFTADFFIYSVGNGWEGSEMSARKPGLNPKVAFVADRSKAVLLYFP